MFGSTNVVFAKVYRHQNYYPDSWQPRKPNKQIVTELVVKSVEIDCVAIGLVALCTVKNVHIC